MNLLTFIPSAPAFLLPVDFTFLLRYEGSIYLLTALSSLLFAIVIFSLLHRASILRDKKWTQPFAVTYLVLAAAYLLFLLQLYLYGHETQYSNAPGNLAIGVILACISGLTNYLFLVSGSRLLEPALMDVQRLLLLQKLGINPAMVRLVVIFLLFLTVVLAVVWVFAPEQSWAAYPDGILSSIALTFMGFALYKNGSLRHEKLVAWLALLSALGYAVLYILWFSGGLDYLVAARLPVNIYEQFPPAEKERFIRLLQETQAVLREELLIKESRRYIPILAGVLMSLLSLPLKFGLFISATSLMLLIFGPLEQIYDLHKNVSEKQEEYLERGGGLVKAVWDVLPGRKVELFIKAPGSTTHEAGGSKKYQIDLFDYPASNGRSVPQFLRLDYDERELYARVMESGTTIADREPSGQSRLGRLIPWLGQFIQRTTRIGVPILFHNSVIACLAVEVGDSDFTGADHIRLERLAVYISPAVQSYRELTALNRIREKAAEHQIKLSVYNMDEDLAKIAEIIHNVVAPLSTGVAIRAGFTDEYSSIHPQTGTLYEPTERQLEAPSDKKVVSDVRVGHRWLKDGKGLTISKVDSSGQKIGEQVFGKFVFAADKESQRRQHPTLGTNITSLYAVSNLLTDIMLVFVRGHLNQLTDRLGARLSSLNVTTVADWFGEVERTAQEAKLLWTVVRYPEGDGRLLGGEDDKRLVEELECPSRAQRWKPKEGGFWLYSLEQPRDRTWHVIRRSFDESSKVSRDSSATLWLGVSRPDFGEELDYVSPWKFFLTHFWNIADSALLRLLINEQQKKRMGEVQSIIAGTLTVGTITHDLAGETRALVSIAEAIERNMPDQMRRDALLSDMRTKRDQIEGLLMKLSDIYKRDPRQTCTLDQVVDRALDRVKYYLTKYRIRVENAVPPGADIDMPFDAAANALAIVIDNGKDAILQRLRDVGGEQGLIRIGFRDVGDMFVCDITDNGPGVPRWLWHKLFKEVSKSKKRNSHGVGLLFSVYLLRLYNGDIRATEWGPLPNTTFSICFPKFLK